MLKTITLTTAEEIRLAVDQGHTVYCDSYGYLVIKDGLGQYLINFREDEPDYYIGLTWRDDTTLNGSKFWYEQNID